MTLRPGSSSEREPPLQEVYFNSYLTGTLLAPFFWALFLSFGIVVYMPLYVTLAVLVFGVPLVLMLGWIKPPTNRVALSENGDIRELLGFGLLGLVGLLVVAIFARWLVRVWMTFFRIVHARFYVRPGKPLASVEGLPTFSGGRRSGYRSSGKAPDTLEVGQMKFDLAHCGRVAELLKLGTQDFLGAEALPAGLAYGFTLQVPLRAWYVPATGVLVRVEMRALGQNELVARAEILERALTDWYASHAAELPEEEKVKTQRLIDELESLKARLASGTPGRAGAEAKDRLGELELFLGWLPKAES